MVPVKFRQVFLAGFQKDRQVAPGEDMGPQSVQALHQVLVMGVEFRRPPVRSTQGMVQRSTTRMMASMVSRCICSGRWGPAMRWQCLHAWLQRHPEVDLQGAEVLGLQVGITQMLKLAGKGQHGSSGLQGDLGGGVHGLDAVNQGGPAPDGRGDVNGLGHLLQVGAGFQGPPGIGVDTVRALDRVGHCQGDEGLFPDAQSPGAHDPLVIVHEAIVEIGAVLADLIKPLQVIFFVVVRTLFLLGMKRRRQGSVP